MSDLIWIKDTLERIERKQDVNFEKINGRLKTVETSQAVHDDQLNGVDGLHEQVKDNEIKLNKIDKRTMIIGLAVVGGTTVGTNLGPIGDILKGLLGA